MVWTEHLSKHGVPLPGVKTQKRIGFFVTDDFSPLGFFSAVEVLRNANMLSEKPLYSWQVVTLTGGPVSTTNGLSLCESTSIADIGQLDMVFVCAGYHPEKSCDDKTLSWLRNLKRHGTNVCSVSTGIYLLAHAGLIGARRCTIHQDNAASFREAFPDINLIDQVFEIDKGLYSCAGGTAAIDLFVSMVAEEIGEKAAATIAYNFQQDRVRSPVDAQSSANRLDLKLKSAKLGEAVEIMQQNIEFPLSFPEISGQIGITQRQLQRIFKKYVSKSPKEYYVNLRVEHSRRILLQTTLSIIEIAMASGFGSHGHYSKCYRARYGMSPTAERQKAR